MINKNTIKLQGIDFSIKLLKEAKAILSIKLQNFVIKKGTQGGLNDIDLDYIARVFVDISSLANAEQMLRKGVYPPKKYIEFLNNSFSKQMYKIFFVEFKEQLEFYEDENNSVEEILNDPKNIIFTHEDE